MKNAILILLVVLLAAGPLLFIHAKQKQETAEPKSQAAAQSDDKAKEADAQPTEIFQGSDDQAKDMITSIRPDYKPWFSSLWTPPSDEVESLLFACQAGLGAGFIGYYFGLKRGRLQADRDGTCPTA